MTASWLAGNSPGKSHPGTLPPQAARSASRGWRAPCTWLSVLGAGLLSVGLPLYVLSHDQREENALRQSELRQIEAKCEEMESRNAGLRQRIRALSEDPRYLETTARAELGWVKDGELLYHFNPPAPSSAAPAPSVSPSPEPASRPPAASSGPAEGAGR